MSLRSIITRSQSSGLWQCVVLQVDIHVPDEHAASIFRAEVCMFRSWVRCTASRVGWYPPISGVTTQRIITSMFLRNVGFRLQDYDIGYNIVRYEALVAVTMKSAVFWVVTPCSSTVKI
jgi:hypothetical protein